MPSRARLGGVHGGESAHPQIPSAFGLIVLAPVIYGALYPQPYLGQLVRQIPIAVVDDDGTALSARDRADA